jgi:endonuclease-3
MTAGTYTLLIELEAPTTIDVGALGTFDFEDGWYAYTGTAFGPGGFSRIDRHRDVATGRNETRHWHVDYLLGDDCARLVGTCRTPNVDAECRFSDRLPGTRVPGFGASDCSCDSHLVFDLSGDELFPALEAMHDRCSIDGEPAGCG